MSHIAIQLLGQPWTERVLDARILLLVALTGIAVFLLRADQPRISRRAVIALVPWMAAAAGLSVLASTVEYPAGVEIAVSGTGAYLTTTAIICFVWFAIRQLGRGGHSEAANTSILIAAMGVGTAAVIMSTLFLEAGRLSGLQLFWLAVGPIASAAVGGLVLVFLGLWYPEAAAYTGAVGGFVIFGQALSAIATAVAVVSGFGTHSVASWAVLGVVVALDLPALLGLDSQLIWAWGYVWVKLLLAIAVVIAMSTYTRTNPTRGNLVLGAVGSVGVIGGVSALLSLVVA